MPGGKPVTEAAGWIPTFPVMVVAPVLVTAGVPARIANESAVPSPTGAGPAAYAACEAASVPITSMTVIRAPRDHLAPRGIVFVLTAARAPRWPASVYMAGQYLLPSGAPHHSLGPAAATASGHAWRSAFPTSIRAWEPPSIPS